MSSTCQGKIDNVYVLGRGQADQVPPAGCCSCGCGHCVVFSNWVGG
jgi:hypothetical protein